MFDFDGANIGLVFLFSRVGGCLQMNQINLLFEQGAFLYVFVGYFWYCWKE